jgi:ABC-type Fe3+ transport system permease subunit
VAQVILPEALPALFAGSSLVLILTMNEYGIVSLAVLLVFSRIQTWAGYR